MYKPELPKIDSLLVDALEDIAQPYALSVPESTEYPFIVFAQTGRALEEQTKDNYVCALTYEFKWVGRDRASGIDAADDIIQALLNLRGASNDYSDIDNVTISGGGESHEEGTIYVQTIIADFVIS